MIKRPISIWEDKREMFQWQDEYVYRREILIEKHKSNLFKKVKELIETSTLEFRR